MKNVSVRSSKDSGPQSRARLAIVSCMTTLDTHLYYSLVVTVFGRLLLAVPFKDYIKKKKASRVQR